MPAWKGSACPSWGERGKEGESRRIQLPKPQIGVQGWRPEGRRRPHTHFELLVQLTAVSVHHCQVQGPEICIETEMETNTGVNGAEVSHPTRALVCVPGKLPPNPHYSQGPGRFSARSQKSKRTRLASGSCLSPPFFSLSHRPAPAAARHRKNPPHAHTHHACGLRLIIH